jgi:hypothetical protein
MKDTYVVVSLRFDEEGNASQVSYRAGRCVDCHQSGPIKGGTGIHPRVFRCSKCGQWVCKECRRQHRCEH